MATLSCVICGKSFEWSKRGHQPHTCGSEECLRKRHSKSVMESRWRSRGGATTQARVCIECGGTFEFVRTVGMRGRGPGFCSPECRAAHERTGVSVRQKAHRDRLPVEERSRRRRVAHLARFQMKVGDYERMLDEQGGVCAICGLVETKHHSFVLAIDHDRSCCAGDGSCGRCVRGLLCSNCNRALGLFGDRPDLLDAAAAYLRRKQS